MTSMLNRTIILLIVVCAGAAAQEDAGFIYVAPGHAPGGATIQGGAGGELVWRFFGFGGDIGYLAPQQSFSSGLGVLSLDPAIHFARHSDSAIDPYFLGGYTLMFRNGVRSGGNYGMGINWWFKRDFGLKVEMRDQVVPSTHFWGVRFGLDFHFD